MVAIVLERLVNVIVLVSQQKQFPEHNFSYFSEKMHHVVRSRRICVKLKKFRFGNFFRVAASRKDECRDTLINPLAQTV